MKLNLKITIANLKRTALKKGYPIFERTINDYNLNIWGIRTSNVKAGLFDDFILIFRQVGDVSKYIAKETPTYKRIIDFDWVIDVFVATTDPSNLTLKSPENTLGTAILVEGFYRGMFKAGKHKGQYEALVQNNPVKVYRDNDKDDVLDFNVPTQVGVFGINLHRASAYNVVDTVGLYSAGCQVVKSVRDFESTIIPLRDNAVKSGYKTFSYTLINESDLCYE